LFEYISQVYCIGYEFERWSNAGNIART